MTTGCSRTEAVYWQTHRRKPLPRQLFYQIALWTSGLGAADKLRLCMVAYCSAPRLPSSAHSQRTSGIYKVNTEVWRKEISYCQKCVQSLVLCDSNLTLNGNSVVSFHSWHYLAAEWRDRFPLDNFRHERPVSALSFAPLCHCGLAFIKLTYWLHMAKVNCVLSSCK